MTRSTCNGSSVVACRPAATACRGLPDTLQYSLILAAAYLTHYSTVWYLPRPTWHTTVQCDTCRGIPDTLQYSLILAAAYLTHYSTVWYLPRPTWHTTVQCDTCRGLPDTLQYSLIQESEIGTQLKEKTCKLYPPWISLLVATSILILSGPIWVIYSHASLNDGDTFWEMRR